MIGQAAASISGARQVPAVVRVVSSHWTLRIEVSASAEDRGHLFAGSGGAGGDTLALMTDALMYLPRIHRAMCRACAQMLTP